MGGKSWMVFSLREGNKVWLSTNVMKKWVCSKADLGVPHLISVVTMKGSHRQFLGPGEQRSPRLPHSPSGLPSWKGTLFAMWSLGGFQMDGGSRQGKIKVNKTKTNKWDTVSGAPTCNSKFTSALASLLKLTEHMASWVSEIPGESLDGILCARFDESYFLIYIVGSPVGTTKLPPFSSANLRVTWGG